MPIMHSGPGGWVPGVTLSDPAWIQSGTSVVKHPAIGRHTYVTGLVSTDGEVGRIPIQGLQGVWG